MDKEIIEPLIEKINEVINSRLTSLDASDLEKLVVVREKLKNAKSKKGLFKQLEILLKLLNGS